MLVVASTHGLYQITQEHSLPKYHALKSFLNPITEGLDIVTMEGDLWKTWRGIFNPGFSAGHLMSLTKSVVEETVTFCDLLQEYSSDQRVFKMKDLTDNLTMDIIGRVVLDTHLESQKHSNPLVDGLRMQVRWLTFGADVNPFTRYNPLRPLVHWYNSRRMNKYVYKEIARRVEKHRIEQSGTVKRSKSIIDLVLTAYFQREGSKSTMDLDKSFKKFTLSQIKLFLFSGHDTTSSTVCYLFYVLASKPAILERVRDEHNKVLGSDAPESASLIISDPFVLNQLPYTIAIIKEVLRMYPAVSSTRAGEPNFSVIDDAGHHYPTNDFLVWANPQIIHRDPTYWMRPDDFLPERWLVSPGDPLYPVKGAWRPFEHGPRNCIGQELAMIEMKVILVMTVRQFELTLAYEKLDKLSGRRGIKTVHGERGYQVQRAQPSDDLPVQVTALIG
ncbi:hypothetical protein G7Y79_00056g090310 [Physcia stellaris]|nr:hypothetical protein G7Y79_00056g090310 [Physcia stellaris]